MNATAQKAVAAVLLLVGVLFLAIGVMFLSTNASDLPEAFGKTKYVQLHKKQLKQVEKNGATIQGGKVYKDGKLATSCPWLNGKDGSCHLAEDNALTKRGVAALVGAAFMIIAAWYASPLRKRRDAAGGMATLTPPPPA